MRFRSLPLSQLTIDDERSFRHVELYADLKQVLLDSEYRFRVPVGQRSPSWDRALFFNLTFWESDAPGGDVLVDTRIAADVVAHAAWHHLARRALSRGDRLSSHGLLLGEAIASAFDLYLVGRLLGHAPDSEFLATQVPAMAEVCSAGGLGEADFEAMLEAVAADPERAFEDLRALLYDATTSLLGCNSVEAAAAALEPLDAHRFAPLLHHYELSNWILAARVAAAHEGVARSATAGTPDGYGGAEPPDDNEAGRDDDPTAFVDRALRDAPVALDWLEHAWLHGCAPK